MKKKINYIMDQINKHIMQKLIFLICFIMLSYGCDIDSKKLQIVNQRNETLFYELQVDTFLKNKTYLYEIAPFETVWPLFVRGSKGAWEYTINRESKDSTLHIFVFKTNSLDDTVIRNHNYERFDFKVKELDSLKWIVIFK